MANAVRPVLDMQERLAAALASTQRLMDSAAGGAVDLGRAEGAAAGGMSEAARAAEEAAVNAAQAAAAQRDQTGSASAVAAAEEAAASAAEAAARANGELAASAFNADAFQRELAASLRAEIAGATASATAARALAGAQEAVAQAAEAAAEAEAHLAGVEAAGSLAAYQDAQAAKAFAEADAELAAAAAVLNDVMAKQPAIMASATAGMGFLDKAMLGLLNTNNQVNQPRRWLWLTANQWHWVFAGGAELLAVVIPAMVALGAAAADASQGAQMVDQHMTALWTAAEATGNQLHITTGQALGFGDALQQAQNKANGQVYQALGGILDGLGGKFSAFAAGSDRALTQVHSGFSGLASAGNQLLTVIDGFVAHIQYDLVTGAGAQMHSLLSGMVTDATELGQVFGNLGHAILNLASGMPGLAGVLLSVLDAFSRLLVILTQPAWYNFGGHLITLVFGFEEVYRWGGLVVSMLERLGLASAISTAGLTGMTKVGVTYINILATIGGLIPRLIGGLLSFAGAAVTGLGKLVTGAENAGGAISGLGTRLTALAGNTALMAWAGAGIAALALLAVGLDHVRNSAQQLIDSTNKAIGSATNLTVLSTITAGLASASAQIAQQEQILNSYSGAAQGAGKAVGGFITMLQQADSPLGGVAQGFLNVVTSQNKWVKTGIEAIPIIGGWISVFSGLFGSTSEAASKIDQLTAAQKRWISEAGNVAAGTALISRQYGTDFTGSLELAQQAGVNLAQGLTGMSQAAVINRIKIADLVSGYQAMGQNSSAISGDMEVLAIQSGLAATKVQQLTQAMQQYDQILVSGTAFLAQYSQSLTSLTTGTNTVTNILGTTKSVTLSVQGFANSLRSFSGQGAQAWQNFDQVAGSTLPQLIGWFQTAGAMGLMSGSKMRQGILDAVSGLTAYAAKSPAAQSEILGIARAAGINVTSWSQLQSQLSGAHAKLSGLGPIVTGVTGQMANLAKVASNLGNVLSADITSTMDAAKVAASNLYTASYNLAKALQNPGSVSAQALSDRIKTLYETQLKLTNSKSDAQAYVQAFADGYGKVGKAAFQAWQQQNQAATQGTEQLKQTMQTAGGWMQTYGQMIGIKAYQGFQSADLGSKLSTSTHQAVQGMANAVTQSSGQAVTATNNMAQLMALRAAALAGPMRSAGANADAGLAAGILAGEGAAVAAAQQVASATAAALAAGLKVHSPSALTHQYGLWLAQGLAEGLSAGTPMIEGAIRALLAMMAFGKAAAITPALLSAPAVSGYPHAPLVPSTTSGGGGSVTIINVTVPVQGSVVTEMQLMDFIRDGFQQYLHVNPNLGLTRQGRPS